MRRPSTLLRTIRALTAIVTVWCVGCSGFDPLLDAVLGAGASVMTCGANGGAMSGEASSPSANVEGAQATVSAVTAAHHGFDCGCGSCHAAAPAQLSFDGIPQLAPTLSPFRIGKLASVVRAPLLPPPQRTA
jgi:cytochrome c553